MTPLFISDPDRIARKLRQPPPRLALLLPRFQAQLAADPAFRRHHIFLPALLGDAAAIAEAREIILQEASQPLLVAGARNAAEEAQARESLDQHIWCIAPRVMRLAAYFTWLNHQGVWSASERRDVARGLMCFFHDFVIPVLRARIPAGHNQQLSMTLCCAVTGTVCAEVPETTDQARALRAESLPRLIQTLGLMRRDAYSGEGSTYQSCVVTPLSMWAGLFLAQQGDDQAWTRTRTPNGSCLLDMLRMEVDLASPGGLLPPWDHYGWEPLRHLAARSLWASLTGNHAVLDAAASVWDHPTHLAWRPDDRLWTILFWPDQEEPAARPVSLLSGWSRPTVGAAIDHLPRRMRVMVAWDVCSWSLQGICRQQVNPNHLMIDCAGEPLTADGTDDGRTLLHAPEAVAQAVESLSATERDLVSQQYGSLDRWMRTAQQGFLGAACAVVVDGREAFFPRGACHGHLVYESRTAERHTFAGDAAGFYQAAFDVTRMRRTVSVGPSGVIWVIDDMAAASPHTFAWRTWFRREARLDGPTRLRLDLPSGVSLTVAWCEPGADGGNQGPLTLTPCATFPAARPSLAWPGDGSTRCDWSAHGSRVRIVTCLVPEAADGLTVRATAPESWEVTWTGGRETFALPAALCTPADAGQASEAAAWCDQETLCDLDETPFALLREPDDILLAHLSHPPVGAWRMTNASMQTLVARRVSASLPLIQALLEDARQNYTVHSVAAWCLGHAAHEPALELLRRMARIPEENTAKRARWAVERIEAQQAGLRATAARA